MTSKNNRIFLSLLLFIFTGAIFFIMVFFFSGCGLKKPKEEIGPLKTVMSIFERGVANQDKAVLDSVYSKKDINSDSLIEEVLRQFLTLKTAEGIDDLHFARRRFSFIEEKDSAQVELILGGEKLKEEKVLSVFLKKRWGEWKIVAQSME
ncbi:MAG: hypothetical protein OEV55_04815 [candidate division Zixibacteria bacterium]|nr:hypothetical protein [candidate division Zixibacteria bacterium]